MAERVFWGRCAHRPDPERARQHTPSPPLNSGRPGQRRAHTPAAAACRAGNCIGAAAALPPAAAASAAALSAASRGSRWHEQRATAAGGQFRTGQRRRAAAGTAGAAAGCCRGQPAAGPARQHLGFWAHLSALQRRQQQQPRAHAEPPNRSHTATGRASAGAAPAPANGGAPRRERHPREAQQRLASLSLGRSPWAPATCMFPAATRSSGAAKAADARRSEHVAAEGRAKQPRRGAVGPALWAAQRRARDAWAHRGRRWWQLRRGKQWELRQWWQSRRRRQLDPQRAAAGELPANSRGAGQPPGNL